jgi:putative NADH-flavin reductase
VSIWTDIWLGVIAVTLLVTAILQVGVLVAVGRVMLGLVRLVSRVEQEIRPLAAHLDAIGRDAAKASSLAVAQVERADVLFTDFSSRVVSTMDVVQRAVGMPAREAGAIVSGIKAVFSVLRESRRKRSGPRTEEDDALFI